MTRLYLLRHGETELNVRAYEIVGGRSNYTELTPRGREQALQAGRWLVDHHIQPTTVIASPAKRTINTVALTLSAMNLPLPIARDDRLQELSQGEMEGRKRQEVWTDEAVRTLNRDPMKFKHPGGESTRDVQKRMYEWLVETCEHCPEETLLVGAHGLATRMLVGKLLNWDHQQIIHGATTSNCSLTLIEHRDGIFTVPYVGRRTDSSSEKSGDSVQ